MSRPPLRALAIATVLAFGVLLRVVVPVAATTDDLPSGTRLIDVPATSVEPSPALPSSVEGDPAPDDSAETPNEPLVPVQPQPEPADPPARGLDPPEEPSPTDSGSIPAPPDPSPSASPLEDSPTTEDPILEPEIPEPIEEPATAPSPTPEPLVLPAAPELPAGSELGPPIASDQATAPSTVTEPEADEVDTLADSDPPVTEAARVARSVAVPATLPAAPPVQAYASEQPIVPLPAVAVSVGGTDPAATTVGSADATEGRTLHRGSPMVRLIDELEHVSAGVMAGLAASNRAPAAAVSVAIEFGRAGSGWAGAIVFNLWLRRQLRERRMSQRQLAALSGVDHSTISRILKDNRRPSLATATMLARALRHLEGESDAAGYFERLPEETLFPSRRVEMALRADELLEESDVRRLMTVYLEARRRRQSAAVVPTPPRAAPTSRSRGNGARNI